MAIMELRLPPNTLFRPTSADLERVTLLHGTCASHLAAVAKEGLRPRLGRDVESNWEHPSHEGAIYLTTAYALHYAGCALSSDFAAILDIDFTALSSDGLVADEDSYALATVTGHEWVQDLPLEERVAFWRENLEDTDPAESLRVLGNCAYLGAIPSTAVRGVRLLQKREVALLTLGVCDPVISPGNFKFYGGTYQRFSAWLVNRAEPADEELTTWFAEVCTPALPMMSLQEAAAHVAK